MPLPLVFCLFVFSNIALEVLKETIKSKDKTELLKNKKLSYSKLQTNYYMETRETWIAIRIIRKLTVVANYNENIKN